MARSALYHARHWIMVEASPEAGVAVSRWRRLVPPSARSWLAVFLAGLLFMLALQAYGRPFAVGGVYFQRHSSEDMMQTLSLLDLRDDPGGSLLVLHIQPPLLDGLRALLLRLGPDVAPRELVVRVDRALYFLWALVYAATGVLVFVWLRRLVRRPLLAALAALLLLLHPAAIYYATYLDTTLVTSFGILWLCHALSSLRDRRTVLSLCAAFVFLFLVRSIFQWPALVVLLASLLLMRVPRRRAAAVVAACGVLVGAYMLKQYLVLGSVSTSSFAGSSCVRALGEEPEMGFSTRMTIPLGPLLANASFERYPGALTRASKITGAHNYNHVADLYNERRLVGVCREKMRSLPVREILRAYSESMSWFLEPSSRYMGEAHAIVDRLPWRAGYDWLFSGWRLLLLVAGATLVWLRGRSRADLARGLGLALPVLFVSIASIVFERGENMRFKFFVEPVLYVFIVSQLAVVLGGRAAAPCMARADRTL
jgi:hypothetical protein